MSIEADISDKPFKVGAPPNLIETTSPSGMNLRPEPSEFVKGSKRVGLVLVSPAIVLCGVLAYSGIIRQKQRALGGFSGPPGKPEPNHTAVNGKTASASSDQNQVQSPSADLPSERVVVRSSPIPTPIFISPAAPPVREASPQGRALASAYASEQQASLALTSIRSGSFNGISRSLGSARVDSLSSLKSLARGLTREGPTKANYPDGRDLN